jgi:diguanylate cyclase (GGDEF)-like protein
MDILATVESVLGKRSCRAIALICLAGILLISAINYLTGEEISVSIFYLIPVAIATWYCGQRSGILFGILSASFWLVADIVSNSYTNQLSPYLNVLFRLTLFLVAIRLLVKLKTYIGIEKQLARTDSLTGLLNVLGFTQQVEMLFDLAGRHNRPLVLGYIDLDNFKRINDERGHSEGDRVLQTIGKVIAASLRATDVAGRMGGDEFAIVLPETDEAGAKTVFNTLGNALLQNMKQHGWPITFSMGVVCFNTPTIGFDEAIRFADSLMYRVKRRGKNNIVFERYQASPARGQ